MAGALRPSFTIDVDGERRGRIGGAPHRRHGLEVEVAVCGILELRINHDIAYSKRQGWHGCNIRVYPAAGVIDLSEHVVGLVEIYNVVSEHGPDRGHPQGVHAGRDPGTSR